MSDIVFLDTETLGLDLDAPIWEVAAIRRSINAGAPSCIVETELHLFINAEPLPWLDSLPAEFADDYRTRFGQNYGKSLAPTVAAGVIHKFLDGRPHIVGAVPDFDTTRIRHQLFRPLLLPDPWHYHLIDIENVVVGYVHGVAARAIDEARMRGEEPNPALVNRRLDLPWKSDELSRAVNVNPDDYARHTAMGDVRWTMAQWDAVTGHA